MTDAAFATVAFSYNGGSLVASRTSDASKYAFPKSQTVDQVVVHGLTEEPNTVLQNGIQVPSMVYQDGTLTLVLPGGVAPDQVNLEFVYN